MAGKICYGWLCSSYYCWNSNRQRASGGIASSPFGSIHVYYLFIFWYVGIPHDTCNDILNFKYFHIKLLWILPKTSKVKFAASGLGKDQFKEVSERILLSSSFIGHALILLSSSFIDCAFYCRSGKLAKKYLRVCLCYKLTCIHVFVYYKLLVSWHILLLLFAEFWSHNSFTNSGLSSYSISGCSDINFHLPICLQELMAFLQFNL